MKKLVSIAALIMLSLALNAQEYEQSIRKWSDGPITWDNFVESSNNYNVPSFIAYGWRGEDKTFKKGNLRIKYYDYYTSMNSVESWVDPYHKSPSVLLYNQTVFDYAEVCRRQLMNEWHNNTNGYSFKELSNFYFQKAERYESEMARQCDYGRDSSMVRFYSQQVSPLLETTDQDYFSSYKIKRGKIGFGFHIGYGNEFLFGDATSYFNPKHGLKGGIDYYYKRIFVYLDGQMGSGGDTPQDFYNNGYLWEKGRHQSAGVFELGLGFEAIDTDWFRLAPFAGIGVGFYDVNAKKGEDLSAAESEVSGFRLQAGIATDIKLLRDYEDMYNQYGEHTIRLTAYAARTNMRIPGPTWSVNFGVMYNMIGWFTPRF